MLICAKKTFFRCLRIFVIFLLCCFIGVFIYGELVKREEQDIGFAGNIRNDLVDFALFAADYLHDTPEADQGINLIDKFKFYFYDDEECHIHTPKIESGQYVFCISGDLAWVGYKLYSRAERFAQIRSQV
jgi:hypothetical protein